MKRKVIIIVIGICVFLLFSIIINFTRNNKVIDENDIGFININNYIDYENYVYGLKDDVNFEMVTDIRNAKIPYNVRNLYNRGYEISVINESDKISIIPNMYINEKIVCKTKNDWNLKKGNIIKINFSTDSRNPIKLGYVYEGKAYTYVVDKTVNNIYEISIPIPGDDTFVLALYNDGDITTCIVNGKIIIE